MCSISTDAAVFLCCMRGMRTTSQSGSRCEGDISVMFLSFVFSPWWLVGYSLHSVG